MKLNDHIFKILLILCAGSLVLVLLGIAIFLAHGAWPVLSATGIKFFTSTEWDPVKGHYGIVTYVFGTAVSSLIALLIAAPLGIATTLFLHEIAPRQFARIAEFAIELLAAIPSVIYGLWSLFILAPFLRNYIEPGLQNSFGFLPFFQGHLYGIGLLCAGITLAIMILPTICSISREIFSAIPNSQRETALALGATKWEMIRIAVLASAKGGILGAMILGLGRALGETMAVSMVIGNTSQISASLFAPAQSMTSLIANEYAEASSELHYSALLAVGLTLLAMSLLVNIIAKYIVWRSIRPWK